MIVLVRPGVPGHFSAKRRMRPARQTVFGGSSNFTYDKTTNTLAVTNASTTNASTTNLYVSGNIGLGSSLTVANGGTVYKPSIIYQVQEPDGTMIRRPEKIREMDDDVPHSNPPQFHRAAREWRRGRSA